LLLGLLAYVATFWEVKHIIKPMEIALLATAWGEGALGIYVLVLEPIVKAYSLYKQRHHKAK
jgi:hypothetical protein